MFKKILNKILYVLLSLVILLSVCNSLWIFIDKTSGYKYPVFGLRQTVIISESMSFKNDKNADFLKDFDNQIQKYDVVCTNMDFTFETLSIGDIVTYRSQKHGLICHRVIDKYIKDDNKWIVCQGDANNTPDFPVSYSDIAGKVYAVIPNLGEFLLFFQSPYGTFGICGVAASIFAAILISDKYAQKHRAPALPGHNLNPDDEKLLDDFSAKYQKEKDELANPNSKINIKKRKKEEKLKAKQAKKEAKKNKK